MTKINADHLRRNAYIYIRQSSEKQVRENLEGKKLQYALKDRAIALGWKDPIIIDDDLGITATGSKSRIGFERILSEVCLGNAGAIFASMADRLARNAREWHTMMEMCGLVQTLIIDNDSVYDVRLPDDRLLLGLKGIFSEMEIHILRKRMLEARLEMAKRGELHTTPAVGYVKTRDHRLEKDPNKRVQDAIVLVFQKFRELGSIRKVHRWFLTNEVTLPAVAYGPEGCHNTWRIPILNQISSILKKPVYSGAYAWGCSATRTTIENGQKKTRRIKGLKQDEWKALIIDHHEGYITWQEFQKNREIIAQNQNRRGTAVQGSPRKGKGLFAGLIRCAHCGSKLHTVYSGLQNHTRYICRISSFRRSLENCISFSALGFEEAIVQHVMEALSPLGVKASLKAIERVEEKSLEIRKQRELAVDQARFESERVKRQYDAVEPENRLVASTLETRWNESLQKLCELEGKLDNMQANEIPINEEEITHLLSLGEDLEFVWNHEASPLELKKRILRTVLKEVVVSEGPNHILKVILHWQGGDHTSLEVKKKRPGAYRRKLSLETAQVVRELARVMRDRDIAAFLNRIAKKTINGNTWTPRRVRSIRSHHDISKYEPGELEARGMLTLEQAASELKVSTSTMQRLIKRNIIPARQACFGAPWIIVKEDLNRKSVQQAVGASQSGKARPQPENPTQGKLDLSTT